MKAVLSPRWVMGLFFSVLMAMALSTLLADDASPPWVAPGRASRKKNPDPPTADSIAAGKAIFISQCVKCHGELGKGDGPSAKDLNPRPKDLSDPVVASQTDGSMYWKITNGRKPMPAFESLISDDDRWNVINYVRTLEPAAATQPTSEPSAQP